MIYIKHQYVSIQVIQTFTVSGSLRVVVHSLHFFIVVPVSMLEKSEGKATPPTGID